MQSNRSPRSRSPSLDGYLSNNLPPTSRPPSNASTGTSPNLATDKPSSPPSSRIPRRSSKLDSSSIHPLASTQRIHTGPIRSHPYRTISRPSTASSIDDGGDASNTSDYEWRPDGIEKGRALTRKGSVQSTLSIPFVGESSSSESMRALMTNSTDEGSGSWTNSLSSPTTSSPTFTFVPHSAQPTSGPLSLDSLPSYPSDQKPPFSYPVLIRLAILGSPQKRLLLSQIYSAIEEKFPWYKDSAPKAWKASVRHCLSLNKEFVRMQRAIEDPGVGCGGWWSVGEGMKGLKRPRKRRTPQEKRSDHEVDTVHTPIIKPPSPILRRRHSVHSNISTESYPLFIPPMASPSPIGSLPPFPDHSLQLAPLHFSGSQQYLPSRTLPFGGDKERDDRMWAGVGRGAGSSRGYSHASTPSTSSSYSAHSHTSSISARRGNPMSISSLLNQPNNPSAIVAPPRSTALIDAPSDSMEIEQEDVDMKEKDTPFSSEQTLRPPSPRPVSQNMASHTPRSRTTPSHHDQPSHRRGKSPHSTRERTPSERRPGISSQRPPPSSKARTSSTYCILPSSQIVSPQQQQPAPAPSTKKKSSGKAWQSVMDLSQMGLESD